MQARNVAEALVDGVPSAPRAELAALARLLESDERSLTARIDCRFVVDGFNIHRARNRARAWLRNPFDARPVAHCDLWRRVDRAARRRDAAGVATRVEWCRGHPRRCHLAAGETTERDAFGNSAVDHLATDWCRLVVAASVDGSAAARDGR